MFYLHFSVAFTTFVKNQPQTIMKHLLFSLALICIALAAGATQYAVFNQNSFEGWIYTRSNVTLTTDFISSYKVTIYKNSAGKDFTLISPSFDTNGQSTIRVKFDWKSTTYGEENYNLTKNSPYIELLDLNDNVIAQCYHQLKEPKIIHDIDVVVKMPANSTGPIKVRIAAWNADTNTPGAVKHVEISNQVNGDVNGDGMINVSDITKLVNVILGIIDLPSEFADVNGDGTVNVSDITALVNIILGI